MTCLVLNSKTVGNGRVKNQVLNVVNNNTVELYDTIVRWKPNQESPGVTSEEISGAMNFLEGDITVRVNSQGGDIGSALGIHSAIKSYKKGKTTAIVDGYAFSSAGWIPQACDNRLIAKGGIFMAHNPQMRPPIGSLDDIESVKNEWLAHKKSIVSIFTSSTNKTEKEVSDMMDATTWLSAEDAISNGFFDGFSEEEADLAALNYSSPEDIPETLWKPKKQEKLPTVAELRAMRADLTSSQRNP